MEDALDKPLRWRKPSRIFVNSMSDLFHEGIDDRTLDRIFAVMRAASQHTFQVLTKRPARALDYARRCMGTTGTEVAARGAGMTAAIGALTGWPLPNVHLGVSVENQETAEERIPLLVQAPAAVRFLSVEPLLGPVSLRWLPVFHENAPHVAQKPNDASTDHLDGLRRIDWVIVGGESGPSARECKIEWVRSVVEQCREAGVPCFVKQLGARPTELGGITGHLEYAIQLRDRKGGDPAEWPEDLRVREFPA